MAEGSRFALFEDGGILKMFKKKKKISSSNAHT
jgi:hypothetical protein